jgi:hypothetical protein
MLNSYAVGLPTLGIDIAVQRSLRAQSDSCNGMSNASSEVVESVGVRQSSGR